VDESATGSANFWSQPGRSRSRRSRTAAWRVEGPSVAGRCSVESERARCTVVPQAAQQEVRDGQVSQFFGVIRAGRQHTVPPANRMIPRCEQGFWHPTRWAGATWSRSEVRKRIWSADTLAPDGTRATTQTTACRPTQEPDPVLAGRSMADESASERPSQGVVLAAFGGATRSEAMSARTCGG
jgi:hypothetical protein